MVSVIGAPLVEWSCPRYERAGKTAIDCSVDLAVDIGAQCRDD
jgi:hypothetical protein